MQIAKLSIVMTLAAMFVVGAHACPTMSPDTLPAYFVSGVMSKNGETIKLVHSVVREQSEVRALETFVKAAIEKHPDFRMVSVLASKDASETCQRRDGLTTA